MKRPCLALALSAMALHVHAGPSATDLISATYGASSFTEITNLAPLWDSLGSFGQTFRILAEDTRWAGSQTFLLRTGPAYRGATEGFNPLFVGSDATGSSLFAGAGVNGFGFKSNKDYRDNTQASSYATSSYGAGRFGSQAQQGAFQVFQIWGTATPTFALAYEDWTDKDFNDMVVTVTAVPEPSTYALMLAGLAVTGWAARRRRLRTP